MADDKDPAEKAKELLVYGPVGLALYLRDTAPSFLRLFVARGRAEVSQRRRSVGDHLGQAKAMGEVASAHGGSQAKNLITDSLAKIKTRAEETLDALGILERDRDGDGNGDGDGDRDGDGDGDRDDDGAAEHDGPTPAATADAEATNVDATAEEPGPPPIAATFDPPPAPTVSAPPALAEEAATDAPSTADADAALAIPDYDELSASQVVDRLEGLSDADLEAIRAHEVASRARNTILGKIDQLTRRN